MRVALERYFGKEMSRVYSLVANVPFSPVDIDVAGLARGEWDALSDRFRVWFLPKGMAQNDKASCYVMIRKFDRQQGILTCAHIVMNLEDAGRDDCPCFSIGILSNDDIRARAMLGVFLGIPPVFHKRSEIELVEGKWKADPATVAQYTANVHSAFAAQSGGKTYELKFDLPADFLKKLGPLDSWWNKPEKSSGEHPTT